MHRQYCIAACSAVIFFNNGGMPASACPPQQSTKLLSPNAGESDFFGQSVAWSENTLLVGCPLADAVADNAGAVYVYELLGGQWTNTQTLVPDDPLPSQYFGSALAIDPDDPDTAVIGSRAESLDAGTQGSAYIFHRNKGGAWTQIQKLTPDEIAGGAWFGYSLAIDGDTLLIGAPLETTINGTWTGSAFAFLRDKSGLWVQQQKLLPQLFVTPSGSIFGASVDVQGDRAIIGAPYIGNEYLPGAVEVFA